MELLPLIHLCITVLICSGFQISIRVISGTVCKEEMASLKLLSMHSIQVCFLLVKSMALCLLPVFIAVHWSGLSGLDNYRGKTICKC